MAGSQATESRASSRVGTETEKVLSEKLNAATEALSELLELSIEDIESEEKLKEHGREIKSQFTNYRKLNKALFDKLKKISATKEMSDLNTDVRFQYE